MKKIISLLTFITTITSAQNDKNSATVRDNVFSSYLSWMYPWLESYTDNKRIHEMHFKEVVKGKESESFLYNEKGLLIKTYFDVYHQQVRRKNVSKIHEYSYDKNNNLTEIKHFDANHHLMWSQSWTYFTDKQLASKLSTQAGKPYEESVYTYNPDSTLARNETYKFKKGAKSLRAYYVYNYYNDRKPKSSEFYTKNKLKHTWSYACDERGKITKKDTTSICNSEGLDNRGRKTVTSFSTNKNAKVTKVVSYYLQVNGKDQLSEYKSYTIKKNKEFMVYASHEPDSLEPFKSAKFFGDDGAIIYEDLVTYAVYNTKTKVLASKNLRHFSSRGQVAYQRLETFKDGLPQTCVQIGKHNKEYGKMEYVFKGNNEFLVNHYKKSKLTKSYQTTISYY